MAQQNTATQVKYVYPIISDSDEADIMSAYSILHGVVASYGRETLPPFEKCGAEEHNRILSRSLDALKGLAAHRKEEAVRVFRQGVKEVVDVHVGLAEKEYEVYADWVKATPAAMRSQIKPMSDHILVPVSEVAHIFAEGTPVEQIVAKLNTMGYKVAKVGVGRDGTYSLRVALPFMAQAANAAK